MTKDTLDKLSRLACHHMYEACKKCGTTGSLEVSHFIRRSNISTRWDPRNLDLLCRSCHTRFELRPWIRYLEWKEHKDGERATDMLCDLNRAAAYRDRYGVLEFKKLTYFALTELLKKKGSTEDIYNMVFNEGCGVVPILEDYNEKA